MMQQPSIRLDSLSYFFLFSLVTATLLFANGFYLFACLAIFVLLFFQVQRPYRAGVFTVIMAQHFLQIISSVIQANYMDKDINFRSLGSGTAILLSLAGLVVLLTPVIYFQRKLPLVTAKSLVDSAKNLSTEKSMYCYIAAFFIGTFLTGIAFLFGGLAQIIISIIKIKWLLFLLFGFLSIVKNEKRSVFYLCICLEILLGFFSFFSEFKVVIYYLVILLATFVVTINIKYIFYAVLIGGGLVYFALVWTRIKGEYRDYLNVGSGQQVVGVSRNDALSKLYELSNKADNSESDNATIAFLDRLQYTYHFAKTIERVPAVIPFQNGDNWLQVLEFTTTPRFLNPDKPTIDNSIKAAKYTGIRYQGASKGTSFSLGYFAECYVDFGFLGMMFPLLLIGLVYGVLYRYFILKASPNLLFNYAVAGSFFMEFNSYEIDGTVLVGRLLASLVTYFVCIKFFFPILINIITNFREKDEDSIVLHR